MNTKSLKVFYDGSCPFCTFSAEKIKKLDWFGKLELFDANDEKLIKNYQVPKEDALMRIQVIKKETLRAEGIDAILLIAKYLPPLWTLIPFIWFSIKVGWGMRLYDWIAKNRLIFPTPGYCPTQNSARVIKKD